MKYSASAIFSSVYGRLVGSLRRRHDGELVLLAIELDQHAQAAFFLAREFQLLADHLAARGGGGGNERRLQNTSPQRIDLLPQASVGGTFVGVDVGVSRYDPARRIARARISRDIRLAG